MQGRSERRDDEVHTALCVNRSPIELFLAIGETPLEILFSESLLPTWSLLSDGRTPLADFFNSL
jgi:hypothetical protein